MGERGETFDTIAARFAAIPYHAHLGMVVAALDEQSVRLRIPFAEVNANPGKALHGGVYASAIDAAAALLARGLGPVDATLAARTLDLTVSYLAAAIGCDVIVEGRLLRRGKELAFVEVTVLDEAEKALARGLVTHRLAPPSPDERTLSDVPAPELMPGEVPKLARTIQSAPFMAARGMNITLMHGGRALVEMPLRDGNEGEDGVLHEGAIAALLDTAGAMASWSVTGVDLRYKASTPAIHVGFHAAARGEGVVAHARTLSRANESFLNAVTVYGATSGRAIASGSVTYRIVT
jgi:uncharacterized protein (TIGR00369 family)